MVLGVMLGAIVYLTCFSTVMDQGGSWTVGVKSGRSVGVMLGAIVYLTCFSTVMDEGGS